jgi:hypothetical protein
MSSSRQGGLNNITTIVDEMQRLLNKKDNLELHEVIRLKELARLVRDVDDNTQLTDCMKDIAKHTDRCGVDTTDDEEED